MKEKRGVFFFSFLFLFLIEVQLIHNVSLVLGVQRSDSITIHYVVLTARIAYHMSPYNALTMPLTIFPKQGVFCNCVSTMPEAETGRQ